MGLHPWEDWYRRGESRRSFLIQSFGVAAFQDSTFAVEEFKITAWAEKTRACTVTMQEDSLLQLIVHTIIRAVISYSCFGDGCHS